LGFSWDGRQRVISSPSIPQAHLVPTTIPQTLSTIDFDL